MSESLKSTLRAKGYTIRLCKGIKSIAGGTAFIQVQRITIFEAGRMFTRKVYTVSIFNGIKVMRSRVSDCDTLHQARLAMATL